MFRIKLLKQIIKNRHFGGFNLGDPAINQMCFSGERNTADPPGQYNTELSLQRGYYIIYFLRFHKKFIKIVFTMIYTKLAKIK